MRVNMKDFTAIDGYDGFSLYTDKNGFVWQIKEGVVRSCRYRYFGIRDEISGHSVDKFWDERGYEVIFDYVIDALENRKAHTTQGEEVSDPTEPELEVPTGGPGVPVDLVQQVVQALSAQAEAAGEETFEDSIDFDEDDDLPSTPSELVAYRQEMVQEALIADEKLRRMSGGRKEVVDAEGKARVAKGADGKSPRDGASSEERDESNVESDDSSSDQGGDSG